VDLNYDEGYTVKNEGRRTRIPTLTLPVTLRETDWVVSVAKLKTHHWAGVTLSMKNLFGVMPGIYYGWPKNLFHWEGIDKSILDINETVKTDFAIVDGVIGMEGDGPIMGTPKPARTNTRIFHHSARGGDCFGTNRFFPCGENRRAQRAAIALSSLSLNDCPLKEQECGFPIVMWRRSLETDSSG
jgi:hypothetical protein